MKKIAIVLLCLGLYSCGSDKGLAQLKALCEIDAGVEIYKTVEANGYYDTTGGFDLVLSPYRFYEYCDDSPSVTDIVTEAGCYRVKKIERELGLCHQGYDTALKKVVVDPYPEFIKNHCISVEKIDKPEALHKFSIKEEVVDSKGDEFFMRYEFSVSNISDDSTLSSQIDYTYFSKGRTLPSYSCHHILDGFKRYSINEFVTKTISPKK